MQSCNLTVRPTRYPELGYVNQQAGLWRVVMMETTTNSRLGTIGPYYHTKQELLADLNRFAAEFGCEV